MCHEGVVEEYAASVHGPQETGDAADGPTCTSCHGAAHGILPQTDPRSPVHPERLAETCGGCHADPALARKYRIPVAQPLEAYRESVHARARSSGQPGATCGSCHGAHGVRRASDPASRVNHQNVPDTCGTCHGEIAAAYRSSVHGRAAAHGAREAPVCTDCHGEHRILSPQEQGSPVFATNVPRMTCGRCHGDLRVAAKYGIPVDRVASYRDSYHGLALRSGSTTVAHCGSCHGVHDVLPSSDPRALTYPDNLPRTCGRCHPGVGTRFAIGPVHVLPTEREHAAVWLVRRAYVGLILFVVGAMVLHNLLDLAAKARRPPDRTPPADAGAERMSRGFRRAHQLLIVSFVTLVWSGFALAYPESWWARPLLRWEDTLSVRGVLHRTAAVAMLLAFGLHFAHVAIDRRARAVVMRLVRPRREDWIELRARIAWYLGRRAAPPRAHGIGYPEKLEYVALLWGTLIMAATGFALWFENLALRWFPKWVTDVATVIHFYEAVLATLAILVWHLYFVIFDPVVYPMDTAWITGRSAPGRERERSDEAS